MLWRYIKAQTFVLLCGGLVGPIFLAVYFAIGDLASSQKWFFYVGLFVTAGDVLIALALTNFGVRSAAMTAALERTGVSALAQVTGITEKGRVNNEPLVKLHLHISGPGFTAFDSTDLVIASGSRMSSITAGKLVALVEPATLRYQIDWERSALPSRSTQAPVSANAGNNTYDLNAASPLVRDILQLFSASGTSLNRVIDVRSDPELRQQIRDLVDRATESAAPGRADADSESVDAAPEASIGERLQSLAALHRSGVLTDQEYASKRVQIIAEI